MALEFKDLQKLKWYYQILIVGGVCAGLLGLLWYQFLSPIEQEIATKETRVAELTQQVAKSLAQQKVFAEFKKQVAELQVRLDSLKSVLPLERETDELLRQVQASASTSGLSINRFTPRPLIDHEVYTEWPIDMDIVGTYHNLGAFLDKIRNLSRIVNIAGIRIAVRNSEGDAAFTNSIGATYTVTTFVYRDEPAAATPAGNP
jgi:type IV pilus assembly protein PilO